MSCEAMRERMTTRLAGELSEAERLELEAHVARCGPCAEEAAELASLWRDLGDLPAEQPGPGVRARFEAMLAREARPSTGLRRLWLPVAASLLIGLGLGYFVRDRQQHEVVALQSQVQDLREMVALTLLERGTVSERLQGIAYGQGVSTEDDRFVGALFTRLLTDPNVNVRLAAIEALRPLASHAGRRSELVAAVPRQQSPLVALSLIDLLLESDDPASRKKLQDLSSDPRLDPAIRGYLRDRLGRSGV